MSDDLRGVIARGLARRRYDHCGGPDGTSLTGKPNWLLCLPDADRALDAIRDAGWTLEPPPEPFPTEEEMLAYEARIDRAMDAVRRRHDKLHRETD